MQMTVELVTTQVFYWNSLPKVSGISLTLSPQAIITGMSIDYGHCKLKFGEYVHTHEETDNNTGKEKTTRAIALRPTGNQQGGYRFYSLSSSRVIRRNHWTVLPMPNEAIDRVHQLSCRKEGGIHFSNRNQQPLWEDDQEAEHEDESNDDDSTLNHLKTVGYMNHTMDGSNPSCLKVIPTLKAYACAMTTVKKYNLDGDVLSTYIDDVVLTQYNMQRGIQLFR